ncbi:MAG: response regulator transcription factor [Erysipelothrix sp.]|nr:response regulator transcription factor [Erysipelothrix sp.]
MKRLLLVEDDETIITGLKYALELEGFEVFVSSLVKTALKLSSESHFDLFVLDINLPDGSGLDLCQQLRKKYPTPIIFLTASDAETNVVMGLDLGADDYITKPFRLRELIGRIKAVLRRYEGQVSSSIEFGDIVIQVQSAKVYKNNHEIILTPMEYRLLLFLAQSPNQIISREQLVSSLWEIGSDFVNDNTLSVYMRRLREKIETKTSDPRYIETIRGVGYRLNT